MLYSERFNKNYKPKKKISKNVSCVQLCFFLARQKG